MKFKILMLVLVGTGLVVACGGGGGGSSDATPTVQTGPLRLTGVVATGDPVKPATAANKVKVKCLKASGVSGEESINLKVDGSYEITLQDSSLPCVLQTDTTTPLSSLAKGAGPGNAVANITPITTLVVARVAGKDPVTFFTEFSTGSAALITDNGVTTAITAVKDRLNTVGISLTGVVNVLTDNISTDASTASTATYDKAVGDLIASLNTSGTQLASVSNDVAASTPPTTTATTSGVASPAAELLLAPRASNCSALRSTRYVSIDFVPSTSTVPPGTAAPVTTVSEVDLDATTLQTKNLTDLNVSTLTPNGPCRYLGSDGLTELVVSPAGIVVGRSASGPTSPVYTMFIAFPKQTFALADLAGTWNNLNWSPANSLLPSVAGILNLSATGAFSNLQCQDDQVFTITSSCTPSAGILPNLRISLAGGGFDLVGNDPQDVWVDRLFAYRAGGGEMMLVDISASGEFTFLSKQRTLTAPALNSTAAFWNMTVNAAGTMPAIGEGSNVITAVRADGSYTRAQTVIGGATPNTHTETLHINSPRIGYTERDEAANVPATGSVTSTNVSRFASLNLRGMGMNALYVMPVPGSAVGATPNFTLSVNK